MTTDYVEHVEQIADALVSKYFNSAGVINCQFVIKLKKVSEAVQIRVNEKLIEKGLPPYDLNTKKSSKKENKIDPDKYVQVLSDIKMDILTVEQMLNDLRVVEKYYQRKLQNTQTDPDSNELALKQTQLTLAHQHARNNKEEIAESITCGCFFCQAIFDAKAVIVFTGSTALCPYCGIDALIGDKSGCELSSNFLLDMFKRWFSIPIQLLTTKCVKKDY